MNENLIKAAEYIEEHGWVRHKFEDLNGAVCLYGAIIKVATRHHDYFGVEDIPEAKHLNKFILDKYGLELNPNHIKDVSFDPVALLNDGVLTSGAEASKVLREAAEWDQNELV